MKKFKFKNGKLYPNVFDRRYVKSSVAIDLITHSINNNRKIFTGEVLDVGAGNIPLLGLYNHHDCNVTTLDWEKSIHRTDKISIVCDLNNLHNNAHLLSSTYDCIVITDVLEHLVNPRSLIKFLCDKLKPGGHIFITTPFMYWEHETPYDYGRYTIHWYDKIGLDVGMNFEVKTRKLGGFFDVCGDILQKFLGKLPWIGFLLSIVIYYVAKGMRLFLSNDDRSFYLSVESIIQKKRDEE